MLYDILVRVALWFEQLPAPWLLLPLVLVLSPPTALIHELGHGLAATLIAKVPVQIELVYGGIDWGGRCRLVGDGSISVFTYGVVIAAGPLASLAQGVIGARLTATTTPGSAVHTVLAAFTLVGYLGALFNLVPFVHGRLRSDGQILLDLGRFAVLGRKSAWIAAATQPPVDPHAATSVAPPG